MKPARLSRSWGVSLLAPAFCFPFWSWFLAVCDRVPALDEEIFDPRAPLALPRFAPPPDGPAPSSSRRGPLLPLKLAPSPPSALDGVRFFGRVRFDFLWSPPSTSFISISCVRRDDLLWLQSAPSVSGEECISISSFLGVGAPTVRSSLSRSLSSLASLTTTPLTVLGVDAVLEVDALAGIFARKAKICAYNMSWRPLIGYLSAMLYSLTTSSRVLAGSWR